MAKKYRVGIVGLDHWYAGLAAAEQAAASDRVELVAIAHRDEAKGRATAERCRAGAFTTDYGAVAGRADLDVVVTACYCSENAGLAGMAARAGSHVLSVKPIAMNAAEADQVVQAVRAAGVKFLSFEASYRVGAPFQQIRAWIDDGRIGRVISAYTLLRSPLPTRPWPDEQGPTWWLDPTKTPGGGWIDHAIYHVDFLRWLLDDEVVRVGGEIANLKYPDIAPLEDFGVGNLRFRDGAIATVEVTWTGSAGASTNQIHIVGTEGQIVWDPTVSGKVALIGRTDPGGWLLVNVPPRGANMLDHLLDAIENDRDTAASVDDARQNLEVCEQFYVAARAGHTINL